MKFISDYIVAFLSARRYAVFAVIARTSVRPSVRLSQAGIVSKRPNKGSKTTPHDSRGTLIL